MKILRIAFATGVSLVGLSSLRADVSFGRNWMQHYYQDPRPDAFVKAVYSLDHDGYFENAGQPDTAIGFFSTVFRQNPQEVDRWLRRADAFLSERPRRILAVAAWLAGIPAGAQRVGDLSAHGDSELRVVADQLLATEPTPVSETRVVSEASMNLQWGAFLASGDERHVISIFAALGSNEPGLATSARFALARDAAAYPRVLEICRDQLDRQPQPIRAKLQAVLNYAASRKPGV